MLVYRKKYYNGLSDMDFYKEWEHHNFHDTVFYNL